MIKYKGVTNYLRILLLGFYQNQAEGERVRAGWNRSYSPHCSLATKIRLFLCLGSKVFYCGGSNLTSPSWTSACTVLGRKKTVPQTVPAGHDSNQALLYVYASLTALRFYSIHVNSDPRLSSGFSTVRDAGFLSWDFLTMFLDGK